MVWPRSKGESTIQAPAAQMSARRPHPGAEPVSRSQGEGLEAERVLVDRARDGDASAQGILFDFYWPKVVRYTFAHCGNQQDAEDLAAEVFLRMVEAIGRFQWREQIPFTAWLFRIARNQVISHYRRRGSLAPLPDDGVGDPLSNDDPEEEVELKLELDAVYRAAEKLPKLQQDVIRLRFAADLSLADTARILEKKENNIKQLQHKAIARMRQLLDSGQV
jgi:RNA polymerase sigma-70 factor (ECF subfamily)